MGITTVAHSAGNRGDEMKHWPGVVGNDIVISGGWRDLPAWPTLWLPLALALALGQSLPTYFRSQRCPCPWLLKYNDLSDPTVWPPSPLPFRLPSLLAHCSPHLVQPEPLSGGIPQLLLLGLGGFYTFPSPTPSSPFPSLPPILLLPLLFMSKSPVTEVRPGGGRVGSWLGWP